MRRYKQTVSRALAKSFRLTAISFNVIVRSALLPVTRTISCASPRSHAQHLDGQECPSYKTKRRNLSHWRKAQLSSLVSSRLCVKFGNACGGRCGVGTKTNIKSKTNEGTSMLRIFIPSLILLLAGSALAQQERHPLEQTARSPNIIVILTDDQGWGDLSVHGNANISTPNIDRLAAQGMALDRFYVCPICSPTRAEFMTGATIPAPASSRQVAAKNAWI